MDFLMKIDEIHQRTRNFYEIPNENNEFSSFIEITPQGDLFTSSFIIKKNEKSQLMLVSGKQRVYLTDLNIIKSILRLEQGDIEWFIREFVEIFNGNTKRFDFKLDGDIVEGIGISYYSVDKKITLFSDTEISINDLICVINFIFSKDKCWEEISHIENFSQRTIVKYITLIDYYSSKAERSKQFLIDIGYPIGSRYPKDNNDINNMFSEIKTFDISKYL